MIVKNESKIITRLFDSLILSPLIDSYCICDTGSTDDTIDIIEAYFREKGIPGEVLVEPFQDFGYNRTFALEKCRDRPLADYILLMDADMILSYGADFDMNKFKQDLTLHQAHYVQQGHGEFFYRNVRFVKNNHGIKYWGVTHEYVDVPPNTTYGVFDMNILYIDDIGDGGCKTDKFLRDVRLLTRALEQKPDNDRYTFYLANSYRDSGQKEKAIETYKKRTKLGGWNEEIWYSYFSIGRAYKELGDMERAVFYWLEAYNAFPDRVENLYEIVHYYRMQGRNELAYMFYRIADVKRGQMKTRDLLFVERDIYNFKLDYELSIVGYYTNPDKYDLAKCSMNLMAYPHIEYPIKVNIMSNYKFYAPAIDTAHSFQLALESPDARFVNSTPSICIHKGKYVVNTRYVNYRINEHGGYDNQEKIETINIFSTYTMNWKKVGIDLVVQHDRSRDNYYVGLEDIRLFSSSDGKLMYNANRGTARGVSIEHGEIDIVTGNTKQSIVLTKREVEKNWVLFEDGEGNMKCIYEWHPLTIGDIRDRAFHTTHESNTSRIFEGFRGSTNGVHIGDEIWFLCHVVSYESRRYYYHVMVALDKTTLKITRYTPFFTFTKECVEYTLGFTYKDGTLLIGYSTMDRTTRYIHVKKTWFDAMFARLGFSC
jgi:tetratricopeptide (TPR) repeat protein